MYRVSWPNKKSLTHLAKYYFTYTEELLLNLRLPIFINYDVFHDGFIFKFLLNKFGLATMQLNKKVTSKPFIQFDSWLFFGPNFEIEVTFAIACFFINLEILDPTFLVGHHGSTVLVFVCDPVHCWLLVNRQIIQFYRLKIRTVLSIDINTCNVSQKSNLQFECHWISDSDFILVFNKLNCHPWHLLHLLGKLLLKFLLVVLFTFGKCLCTIKES